MIVAEQKPLDEIKQLISGAENVLVVGCGTCVTVCFSGGEKEAGILSTSLRMSTNLDGEAKDVKDVTVQRQCLSRKGVYDIATICGDQCMGTGLLIQSLEMTVSKPWTE